MSDLEVHFAGEAFVADAPRVPATSPALLVGDGVFATLRAYEGVCFAKDEHLEGLARGASLFGLPAPPPWLADRLDEAARRTGAGDAVVRVTIGRDLPLLVRARPIDAPSEDAYGRGVAVVTSRLVRHPPIDPRVKTTSYAREILARREAEARGAFEAIQLGADGALACGAMSNLFVVRGDRLSTPPLASGCRDGVTRRLVLRLAGGAGLDAREERIDPRDLDRADEIFLTSVRVECLPVSTVDGRPVRAPGSRAAELRRALRRAATPSATRDLR